jgi:hypothetical protein
MMFNFVISSFTRTNNNTYQAANYAQSNKSTNDTSTSTSSNDDSLPYWSNIGRNHGGRYDSSWSNVGCNSRSHVGRDDSSWSYITWSHVSNIHGWTEHNWWRSV